jgi:hypothetical protein
VELENRVENKRLKLRKMHERMILISQFLNRNRNQHHLNQENMFKLPLLVVSTSSKMVVELEREKVEIHSRAKFELLDDMECISRVLKSPKPKNVRPVSFSMFKH